MNLKDLQDYSVRRSRDHFHTSGWTLADWIVALTGEVGEMANVAKKIRRGSDMTKGMSQDQLKEALAAELADIQCYLVLVADSAGVDLADATVRKFNEVSGRVSAPTFGQYEMGAP